MGFWDWVSHFFGAGQTELYLTDKALASAEVKLALEAFATHSAINLVANTVSKCEFKTYLKGQPVKADEYYLWNVEPNVNQSSSQFLQELVGKLLFNNECLVYQVGGQLFVADSFHQVEFAARENYFTDVTKGELTFRKPFMMSEVLYFRHGNEDIRRHLHRLMCGYNDLINMTVSKYRRSGGRKGIARVDKIMEGDEERKKQIDEMFSAQFRSYFDSENAVIHLPKGVEYTEDKSDAGRKSTSEVSDLAVLTREAFERAAQAFRIPPALLKGELADIGQVTDNFLTFSVDPLLDIISEEANRKRYGKAAYLAGHYLQPDSTCIKHTDIFTIAAAFDKLIASGGYCIDDLRVKCGDAPLNTPWSRKHFITKNYTGIEDPEGGTNEDKALAP